jgi:hypothetical protein
LRAKFEKMTGTNQSEKLRTLVSVWQTSGQTQKEFAAANNINLHTFKYWLYKIRGEQAGVGSFIRLDHQMFPELCLRYPNGVELLVPAQTSPSLLRELVKIGG